ncbi:glial fibrillary acidic protein-like [Cucumis melo var. makuwa]|uniref:Glial fibrillary acidic protein-like n=2 Tax=Cucumis melo TaxID=3656 RepID=A0A5A7T4I7_CUCMM|nr:glial fibrillary acidic protein-like [Cucumis melo var. makuwa]
MQVRKKNERLLWNIADLHEETEANKTAMEIEVLQHSIKEYKSQLIEAESKNRFLQKVVNSSESQLLICCKVRKVATDDYAQLIEKYQEMSIDFMMWRDEYETLRCKYDGARGQMERGAKKLRQMVRMADQLSVQARALQQDKKPNCKIAQGSPPQHPYWTRRKAQIMDEQTNDLVQAVRTSSQVEVDLNQVLEDTSAYPPSFTPQRLPSPRMVDRTYPTSFLASNSNTTTQQAAHVE